MHNYVTDSMEREMAPKPAAKWITQAEAEAGNAAEDTPYRRLWYATAIQSTVGVAVLKYRYDHGLSQTAFGKLVGMSQPQVARLELGDHPRRSKPCCASPRRQDSRSR